MSQVASQLAKLGGRRGRKAARRLLERTGTLQLSDAERTEREAAALGKAAARKRAIERVAPNVVYAIAVTFGAGGQVATVGHALHLDWSALIPTDILRFLFTIFILITGIGAATLIEGSGLAFATIATKARLAGRRATGARAATWTCALAACGINAWGHWGSPWAYPTSLGSIAALTLWELDTMLQTAAVLAEFQAKQRREAAVRKLAIKAVRAQRGRRVARLVIATLPPEELQTLVEKTVGPREVLQLAVAARVHTRTETARPDDIRWWQFRRRARWVRERRWRADDDARALLDGSLPDAPVSPAPTGAADARAEARTDGDDARGNDTRAVDSDSDNNAREPDARGDVESGARDTAPDAEPRGKKRRRRAREAAVPDDAREWIAERLRAGEEVSGKVVALKFKRHEGTGRKWIKSVRSALDLTPVG